MDHANRVRNKIQVDGHDETPDTTAIEILLQDDSENVVIGRGTTVPSAESGYAKGCLFIKTNAGNGVKALYENQGTTASCSFNLVGDITTAEIADNSITKAKLALGISPILYADRLVSNAELKALRATPIELVPATEAGAGFAIIPLSVVLSLNAGTEVLTESADNLAIKCSTTEIFDIETTGFIDQATDQNRYQEKAEAVMTPIANTAITLTNKGDGEIAGNATADATLSVRTYYKIVPVL